jgi:tRNA threonylcarbamoyladenosine biosynthesis protein TsaB
VIILAFDACFGGCSVAVWRDGVCCATDALPPGPGQADLLLPMVAATLARASLAITDVDRFAVTVGPGGFTGVRVGVAAARAFALATGKPVVATTSLHVMAIAALDLCPELYAERDLVVAVDAHRGELYVQCFDGAAAALAPPLAVAVGDAAWLPHGSVARRPLLIVGTGAAILADAAQKLGLSVHVSLPTLLPSAQYLGQIAGTLVPRSLLSPLYLRAPDAKPSSIALPSRVP